MRNEKELRLTKAERRRFAAEINGGDGRCLFCVCVCVEKGKAVGILLEYKSSNIHNVGRSTYEETFRVFLIVTANILFPHFTPNYTFYTIQMTKIRIFPPFVVIPPLRHKFSFTFFP